MTGRRCTSMSAYMDGPWRCGNPTCNGGEGCKAHRRNVAESTFVAAAEASHRYENAWRKALGLPLLTFTIRDARSALFGRPI